MKKDELAQYLRKMFNNMQDKPKAGCLVEATNLARKYTGQRSYFYAAFCEIAAGKMAFAEVALTFQNILSAFISHIEIRAFRLFVLVFARPFGRRP